MLLFYEIKERKDIKLKTTETSKDGIAYVQSQGFANLLLTNAPKIQDSRNEKIY